MGFYHFGENECGHIHCILDWNIGYFYTEDSRGEVSVNASIALTRRARFCTFPN
jgi:hypothetical protein